MPATYPAMSQKYSAYNEKNSLSHSCVPFTNEQKGLLWRDQNLVHHAQILM